MNGKFYSDITRDTFSKHRHFRRVIMQQGRVQLDADWNEQTDILLHYMRALAADLLGPHVAAGDGFKVTPSQDTKGKITAYQFAINQGHCYIDGILCENDHRQCLYNIPTSMQSKDTEMWYLLYLDMWEQEITYLEDSYIREAALGGRDTATRSAVVWKIRAFQFTKDQLDEILAKAKANNECLLQAPNAPWPNIDWICWLRKHFHTNHGFMKAQPMQPETVSTNPCITSPTSQFRGEENQLYRVEIQHGGQAWPAQSGGQSSTSTRAASRSRAAAQAKAITNATFKWSRDNGSVVFPVVGAIDVGTIAGGSTLTVTLAGFGRDEDRFTLAKDDWVELVQFDGSFERAAGPLLQVQTVDHLDSQVTLLATEDVTLDTGTAVTLMLLRRWNQRAGDPSAPGAIQLAPDGAVMLIENTWLTLENGVQVRFHSDVGQGKKKDTDKELEDTQPIYHPGDYWLIPARAAKGDIEWPRGSHGHEILPPHGVEHHYAPLAFLGLSAGGNKVNNYTDLRDPINNS